MLAIDVRSNVAEVIRSLGAVRTDQIPFGTARALTNTAREARDVVRSEMPQRFTVRRPWIQQGVRFSGATKQSLTATVFDKDPFMAIQETGGEKVSIRKRVFDYGEYLAIPLDARRSKRDVVDKRDWPQNLIHPYILTARDGRKYLAVHDIVVANRIVGLRTARGKQKRATGTRLMYVLVKRETVRARFGFRTTVERVARERFPINFAQSMRDAQATAK